MGIPLEGPWQRNSPLTHDLREQAGLNVHNHRAASGPLYWDWLISELEMMCLDNFGVSDIGKKKKKKVTIGPP